MRAEQREARRLARIERNRAWRERQEDWAYTLNRWTAFGLMAYAGYWVTVTLLGG